MQTRRPYYAPTGTMKPEHQCSRRSRSRRGVILLLVISLLALFVLMGVSFSLVALQSLNASKLDIKINQREDDPSSEFDLILGQLLYDTRARTVMQYHSLLRDLYGYDADTVLNPAVNAPQLRESLQGTVVNVQQQPNGLNLPNAPSAGGQLYTFTFALGPYPPTATNLFTNASALPLDASNNPYIPPSVTALSTIPNYYAGRVITFQGPGPTSNHSSRIVSYNPVAGYSQHQIVSASFNAAGVTSYYYPAYGQITIEAIESKLAGSVTPQVGDTFVINGAPFNGTGAGYDPITANLDAVLVNNSAIAAAQAGPSALTAVTGMQNLGEYAALLPNYASYNANNSQLVFNALHPTAPNFLTKPANQMGFGGYDESYDVPDYQNMFLAMVAPRTAEAQFSGSPLPIIPSFHRPELVNYWVNFIQQSILTPAGLPATAGSPTTTEQQLILYVMMYPYGPNRVRENGGDDPIGINGTSITINHLDRIYNILRGCIFRPMPWDHPNFTGSNPNFNPPLNPTDTQGQFNLIANLINSPVLPQPLGPPVPPANRPIWDVDTDGDGIPESIWIDPGLPIMTTPEGRRYKRLAAIQVRDLDGLINVNAHGNVQQLYAQNIGGTPVYPYLARTPLQSGMMTGGAGTYQTMPTPAMAPYAYTVGLGISNQLFPRGLGFGPAEVQFSNIFSNDAVAYANMLFGRYVSQRQTFPFVLPDGSRYTTQPVPDTMALDSGMGSVLNTGFPYARPGVPYSRDPLSVVKHSGVPNDYANSLGLAYSNLQPSWYASPPDVWGRGAVVLDVGGQPLMTFMGQPNEMLDSPYELSLSGEENGTDSPYTVAELEVLYRYHDLDATQLSRRLLLAGIGTGGTNWLATENPGVIGTSHSRRNMLTTHASHIPAPSMRAPQEARVNPNLTPFMPMLGSTSILDLYRAKLKANGLTDAQVTQQMLKIVPWEFFKGQKFDINRWLGDGVSAAFDRAFSGDDFNGDGTPDDNNGDSKNDVPNMTLPRPFVNVLANHTNRFSMADGYSARQAYARHLFCLAMLLLPDDPTAAGQKFQPPISYDPDANNPANARKLIIRRLAQWAINCVDFRDSDTALTPFEYDENPWNGWSVDGHIGVSPGQDGAWGFAGVDDNMNGVIDDRAEYGAAGSDDAPSDDNTGNPERGLVWGMETPGVLLTETLAFHDRGVKDTDQDNGAMPNGGKKVTAAMTPDDDLDQFRMPKGSMFVELYSPRPTVWNGEQTGYKPSSGALNLAHMVPAVPGVVTARPLWRLAFSRLRGGVATGDPNNPAVLSGTNPETVTPELILPNGTSWTVKMSPFDTAKQLTVDRFAYFVDASGVLPANELDASFVNANVPAGNSLSLAPGQYAVVGPRRLTYLGSQNPASATPTPPATSLWGGNSNQYIQLVPNAAVGTESVVVKDTTGLTTSRTSTPAASADARQPVAIVCDMASSLGWRVGMNVSEPLVTGANYYPSTTFPPSDSTTVNLATNPTAAPGPRVTYPDFYDDPDAPSKQFRDQPIEGTGGSPTWPIVANNMQATGTYLDCSSVLLQRLADSTSPYNPMPYDAAGNPDPNYNQNLPVNPYITVDWSTADLTVFTGEEDATNSAFSAQDIYYNNTTPSLYFRSRQRGFLANSGTNNLTSNPWPPISQNGVNATWKTSLIGKTTPTYFGLDLSNASKTAAHPINSGYTPTPTYTILGDNHTLGSLNSTLDYPVVNGMLGTTNYYGEPFIPFPWMTWNNRPFSNPMEMLFVPSSSPGRLALEMTPDYPLLPNNTVSPPTLNNPYLESAATARPFLMHWPFGHMLNLFQTSQIRMDVDNSGATPTFPLAQSSAVTAPHLFRLFDYVEVPSPYVGAERWYNPQNFTTTAAYAPPFNKLSRFRDPGRVNLNTVYDDEVWNSLVAQFPGLQSTDGFTAQFALSRQGDSGTVNVMNPAWPTRFANPFRSADSADLTPNVTAMRAQAQFSIQATLLRANTSGGTPQPLFQINSTNPMASQWMSGTAPGRNTLPGTPGSMANAHDTNRNPYFRYQPLQKLGAVAANNSNCFAVWITIGYFEVEENRPNMTLPVGPGNLMTFDAAHPDGYCLGQEIGIDSGEVTRHRSFYIIDRSIPVGFIPGSRLNTDDCILVRRLIE